MIIKKARAIKLSLSNPQYWLWPVCIGCGSSIYQGYFWNLRLGYFHLCCLFKHGRKISRQQKEYNEHYDA